MGILVAIGSDAEVDLDALQVCIDEMIRRRRRDAIMIMRMRTLQ